jgi:hypothetical protein
MTDENTLTPLQQDERDALTGDRRAVLRVVSALRAYREAVKTALDTRWGDDAIDGAHSHSLACAVKEIEGPDEEE